MSRESLASFPSGGALGIGVNVGVQVGHSILVGRYNARHGRRRALPRQKLPVGRCRRALAQEPGWGGVGERKAETGASGSKESRQAKRKQSGCKQQTEQPKQLSQ